MNYPRPVIAELPVYAVPAGRSRLAVFLDGDTSNTEQGNVIDEDFFENCYTYEDYLESYEMLDGLFEICHSLQEKLKQAEQTIARLQNARHAE